MSLEQPQNIPREERPREFIAVTDASRARRHVLAGMFTEGVTVVTATHEDPTAPIFLRPGEIYIHATLPDTQAFRDYEKVLNRPQRTNTSRPRRA
jgi:hypothetical protein